MLITFEGMDGSGKTTLARAVADELARSMPHVEHLEKKDVTFGSAYVKRHLGAIKGVLWDYAPDDPLPELGDRHWLHLQASWFAALDHGRIRPASAEGKIVVLDNWYFKIMARFLLKPAFDRREIEQAFEYLTKPAFVFLLDIPASTALRRKRHLSPAECGILDGFSGQGSESFETYQEKVRAQMLKLGDERGFHLLDATLPPEQLVAECVARVRASVPEQRVDPGARVA